MTQEPNVFITQFFTDLLGLEPKIDISDSQEQIDIALKLEPQDSGIIIGYRGEALTSIQLLLSLVNQKQTGSWKPVRLNINDYRQKRQQALEEIANKAAERAIQTNQPVPITNLTSFERRIVHASLTDNSDIKTYSEGDHPNRILFVSPK